MKIVRSPTNLTQARENDTHKASKSYSCLSCMLIMIQYWCLLSRFVCISVVLRVRTVIISQNNYYAYPI